VKSACGGLAATARGRRRSIQTRYGTLDENPVNAGGSLRLGELFDRLGRWL